MGGLASEVSKPPDSGPPANRAQALQSPCRSSLIPRTLACPASWFAPCPGSTRPGAAPELPINRALGLACAPDQAGSLGMSLLSACFLMSKIEELSRDKMGWCLYRASSLDVLFPSFFSLTYAVSDPFQKVLEGEVFRDGPSLGLPTSWESSGEGLR